MLKDAVISHERLESIYFNNIETKELELNTPNLQELTVICFHSLSTQLLKFLFNLFSIS